MKTKTYHVSRMGNMVSLPVRSNVNGYVTYHDSPRYRTATDEQLAEWAEYGRTLAVRNAAGTEIGCRNLAEWQYK